MCGKAVLGFMGEFASQNTATASFDFKLRIGKKPAQLHSVSNSESLEKCGNTNLGSTPSLAAQKPSYRRWIDCQAQTARNSRNSFIRHRAASCGGISAIASSGNIGRSNRRCVWSYKQPSPIRTYRRAGGPAALASLRRQAFIQPCPDSLECHLGIAPAFSKG